MTPFVLVSGDFVTTGGMDRANFALADFLSRRGHPVCLVAHRVADELTERPSVTISRVPKLLSSYFLSQSLLFQAGLACGNRVARRAGRVVVNGGNCPFSDVNWVHYLHAAYRPDSRVGLVRRFKGVLERRWALATERFALRRARLILANSEVTRRHILEHLQLPEERVRTVYYGIDPNRFRPWGSGERAGARVRLGWPVDRPVVAFVGALGDRRKGFDTLFEAWRLLCASKEWDGDLVVIGTGAELSVWQERARASGLSQRIRFLGFRRDVPDLLPACDVLVAPTRYEAYGLGVHEAICCGVPALVARSAGVAERYSRELEGLLLDDPDDATALAGLLREWHSREGQYRTATETLGARLRARTWDDMAGDITKIIGLNE